MWHLIRLGIHFRWLTILIAIMLTGAAIWGTFQLKTELIPNIEFPFTSVITVYPDALPEEVVSEVTVPVEDVIGERVNGQGLKHISSTSASGISVIFMTFEYGTNMGDTNRVIEEAIDGINLPDEVRQLEGNPQIIPIDPNQMPVVILSLSGDYSQYELKSIAEDKFIPFFTQIEGVYTAEVEGGDKERIIISPDPQQLVTSNISVYQIASLLTLNGQFDSLDAIKNAPMGVNSSIVLGDIASVGPGPAPNKAITRTNGKPSVAIFVMKHTDANTVDTANAVMEEARDIEADLNGDITVVALLDQSEFIEDSVNQLLQMAIIGFILAIIIVFLFLMAFRASLVTAISIPVSVLIGFLVMYFTGITINILTLSAMAIAVGRLIDNSIVVTEVIYRRMKAGEGWREAAIGGAKEVAAPLTSATLATVAIFLPLAFVGGIVGELFVPFALTITFSLIASLLVALIVVPAFSKWFTGKKSDRRREEKARPSTTWYQRGYISVLKWSLGHRVIVVVITFILFAGSIMLIPLVGTSFLPAMSEPMLVVQIELPPGTELNETRDVAVEVESVIVDEMQNMQYYWSTIGTSASLFGVMSTIAGGGDNTAEITIMLEADTDMKKERYALDKSLDDLRDKMGFDFAKVLTSVEAEAGFMGGGVDLEVVGESRDEVNHAAELLYESLLEVEGISNLETQLTLVVPILDIELDLDKMIDMGLSDEQINGAHQEKYLLRAGTSSDDVLVSIDGESYGITLKGISQDLYIADDPKGLTEALPMGYPVFGNLSSIADVDLPLSPTHIGHYDLQLAASITGTVDEKDAGAVSREVNDIVDEVLATPGLEGVDVEMGGMFEEMAEGFSSMAIAIIAASFIAFLILVISMRSVFNPLIIMVSLPLASIGAILALLISGYTLGMSGMMGILMLIGIVLTNAIVLIALVVQLRKRGMSTYDALIEGGQTRLRPILMTALTTMIAMIPLAVGVGAGTFIAAELAVVVIGGLFTSTLLTLVVIPVVYSLADSLRSRKRVAVTTGDIRCPKCGSATVAMTAKRGPNTGSRFHVCSRYPECKGKVPLSD